MCDLICDVITCCVRSCDMVKSMEMTKSWSKTRKEKIWKSYFLYINLHLIDGLGTEFTAWHHLQYVTHIATL